MNGVVTTFIPEPTANLGDAAIPGATDVFEDVADSLPIQYTKGLTGLRLQSYGATGKAIVILAPPPPPKTRGIPHGLELLQRLAEVQEMDIEFIYLSNLGLAAADTSQHEIREVPLTQAREEVLGLITERPGIDEYDISLQLSLPLEQVFEACDALFSEGKIESEGHGKAE